jgi:MFS transporter, DHA2 family, multidrug resistance protein
MSANTTPARLSAAGPVAGRQEWAGLAVLALASLLMSIDLSVLTLALPKLSTDLGASSSQQLWILDIYGFMTAGFLITMGTIGDRIGRRKVLLTGAAVFGIVSIIAAYSTNPAMLITARAVMGIAAATVMPSSMALIASMFKNPAQRGMAISMWMSCFMVGMLIGPVIGGVLLHFFWWGSVFLIGVPVMALFVAVAPRLLPEERSPQEGRLDLVSVALSLGAVLAIAYGLQEAAQDGWNAGLMALIVAGALLAVAFVVRQRRLADPLVDLSLFRIPSLRVALVLGLLGGAVQGASAVLVNLYLQLVQGMSSLAAGLWLLPTFAAMIVGLMLGPGVAQRVKPGYVIAAGLPITTIGYLVITQVKATSGLPLILIGFAIVLFGVGIPMGLGTGLGLAAAPPQKVGAASSLTQTSNELGVALGIATLGSVGTAVYRSQLNHKLPSGLPQDSGDTARHSIESAVAVAHQIPGQLGNALLVGAREAFTSGLNVVALIAAVVMAALAVLAGVTLRDIAPGGTGPGGPPMSEMTGPDPSQADEMQRTSLAAD